MDFLSSWDNPLEISQSSGYQHNISIGYASILDASNSYVSLTSFPVFWLWQYRLLLVSWKWTKFRKEFQLKKKSVLPWQEHWSGLPFPSPMQETEKWKWSHSAVSDSSQPHGLKPTRLPHPWDFPGKSTGVGCHCLLRFTPDVYIFPLRY